MKKQLATSFLGLTLALTAACEHAPADAINHDIAGRDRLGHAANALLNKMDLVHPTNGVTVNMEGTRVESPFNNDKTPWLKQAGTVRSSYGSCTIEAVGRQNPDGTFAGEGFNGAIRIPYLSKLVVTASEGSVDFEVGNPAAYNGGDPSLSINGTVYTPTPGEGESQLTDGTINTASALAGSLLELCGAIPGYVPPSTNK